MKNRDPVVEATGNTLSIEIGGSVIYLTRDQAISLKEQLSEYICLLPEPEDEE